MYKALSIFAMLAHAHATELGAATEAETEVGTDLEANLLTDAQAQALPELDFEILAQIEAQAESEYMQPFEGPTRSQDADSILYLAQSGAQLSSEIEADSSSELDS